MKPIALTLLLSLCLASCNNNQVSAETAYKNCVQQSYQDLAAKKNTVPESGQKKLKEDYKKMAETSCAIIKKTCPGTNEMEKLSCHRTLPAARLSFLRLP